MYRRSTVYVAAAAALAGTSDIVFAILFSWLRSQTPPLRVLQSVASGVLGRGAYAGGLPAGALGLSLHFVIAFSVAAFYFFLSSRLPLLIQRPIPSGFTYGVAVFAFMNLVVLPLSRIGQTPAFTPASLAGGLAAHMFLVGIPIALIARRAHHRHGMPLLGPKSKPTSA